MYPEAQRMKSPQNHHPNYHPVFQVLATPTPLAHGSCLPDVIMLRLTMIALGNIAWILLGWISLTAAVSPLA